jgi:hypothetical protein
MLALYASNSELLPIASKLKAVVGGQVVKIATGDVELVSASKVWTL